jgi:hypothetical protein
MSKGAIQVSPPRLSAQIFARGSVSERTQSSSARVQNRHQSRPRASAVCASWFAEEARQQFAVGILAQQRSNRGFKQLQVHGERSNRSPSHIPLTGCAD